MKSKYYTDSQVMSLVSCMISLGLSIGSAILLGNPVFSFVSWVAALFCCLAIILGAE